MEEMRKQSAPEMCSCGKYRFPNIASVKVQPENVKYAIMELTILLKCPACKDGLMKVDLVPSKTGSVRSQ